MCVNLRENVLVRQSGSDPTEPQDKRQKVTHDFFPTKPPTSCPSKKERPEASAVGGSKVVSKPVGSTGNVVVHSVKADPSLAVTMLQGLALPKDMEKVPQDLQPSLVHASAYLVQVCLNPILLLSLLLFSLSFRT